MGVITPALLVQRQPFEAARYGLLAAATIVPPEDGQRFRSGVEWEGAPTPFASVAPQECVSVVQRDVQEGIDLLEAPPIVVYAGFTCKTVGLTNGEAEQRAEEALAAAESAVIEAAVWAGPGRNLTTGAEVLPDAPLPDAVGALEDWAYRNLPGQAVLHAPRSFGAPARAAQVAEPPSGAFLTTGLGNRWSFGGYTATRQIAVSGAVQVRRSSIEIRQTNLGSQVNLPTNEIFVFAERTYVASWDGPTALIGVS